MPSTTKHKRYSDLSICSTTLIHQLEICSPLMIKQMIASKRNPSFIISLCQLCEKILLWHMKNIKQDNNFFGLLIGSLLITNFLSISLLTCCDGKKILEIRQLVKESTESIDLIIMVVTMLMKMMTVSWVSESVSVEHCSHLCEHH